MVIFLSVRFSKGRTRGSPVQFRRARAFTSRRAPSFLQLSSYGSAPSKKLNHKMVSSTTVETLASPQSVLRDLYEKALKDHNEHELPEIVTAHFSSVFARDTDLNQVGAYNSYHVLESKPLHLLSQVPSVDIRCPPEVYQPGSLVRFRGMVQDTSCSPETFDDAFGWGTDLGTSEGTQPSHLNTHGRPSLAQRDVLWAVNIPGEADWLLPSSPHASPMQTYQGETHRPDMTKMPS